ncbi:MAG TPA: hypothetical protein ENJ28_04970 [Gammaproteobacteria bacterium]|nr:hypothetical protein [Gammaproteobacteria bacterium]
MKHATDTIKLELERLILLRESITTSGVASLPESQLKLHQLNEKIYSHEQALSLLVRHYQDVVRLVANIETSLKH